MGVAPKSSILDWDVPLKTIQRQRGSPIPRTPENRYVVNHGGWFSNIIICIYIYITNIVAMYTNTVISDILRRTIANNNQYFG